MSETESAWYMRAAGLIRDLAKAQAASERASEARRNAAPGTSRAKITTLNARWARAAEHRDRLAAELAELGVVLPSSPRGAA